MRAIGCSPNEQHGETGDARRDGDGRRKSRETAESREVLETRDDRLRSQADPSAEGVRVKAGQALATRTPHLPQGDVEWGQPSSLSTNTAHATQGGGGALVDVAATPPLARVLPSV